MIKNQIKQKKMLRSPKVIRKKSKERSRRRSPKVIRKRSKERSRRRSPKVIRKRSSRKSYSPIGNIVATSISFAAIISAILYLIKKEAGAEKVEKKNEVVNTKVDTENKKVDAKNKEVPLLKVSETKSDLSVRRDGSPGEAGAEKKGTEKVGVADGEDVDL
jgi:hypothetical protein